MYRVMAWDKRMRALFMVTWKLTAFPDQYRIKAEWKNRAAANKWAATNQKRVPYGYMVIWQEDIERSQAGEKS